MKFATFLLGLGVWCSTAVAAEPGVYDVRDYGAKGDSKTDDTDAIQAAIDAALGSPGKKKEEADAMARTRYANGSVHLPAGTYKITRPLKFWGVMYLRFLGEGGSTRLFPVGKMESVLDINGASNCEFANFRIEGDGKSEEVQNAIYFYWDKSGRTSAFCNFHDIAILSTRCVTGFRIGKPGTSGQVDTSTYRNISLYGSWTADDKTWWQHGFYVGSDVFANCLVHSFYDPSITHWAEGCHVSVTNFSLVGGNFGGNGVDFVAHTLSYFLVQGIRSESSGRLLVSGSGATHSSANFSLTDILFWTDKLHEDNEIIRFFQNGTLSIRNLVITPGAPNPVAKIDPLHSCSLILDGVTCANTLEGFLDGINKRVDVSARGFVTERADGKGFSEASRGLVTTGSVRWLGSGELKSENGGLYFRSSKGRVTTLVRPDRSTRP